VSFDSRFGEKLLDVVAGALDAGAPVRVERDGPLRAYVTSRDGEIALITVLVVARRHSPPPPDLELGRALSLLDLER
jgi:hypothetical protein